MIKQRERTANQSQHRNVIRHVYEYGYLFTGTLIVALSFNLFLNPNRIASGGVSGISTLVHHVMDIQPAITQWVLNIPLFLLGLWLLGKHFGIKTAMGSVLLPLMILLTQHMQPLTTNILLACIYGGIGVGIGLGVVFRGRGSTGGLDLAAQIIHKYTGLSLGITVAMLDGLVILAAGFVFSPEQALFALISLYVTSKTIDVVQMGLRVSKVAFIISNHPEEISDAVLHELDRGLTKLQGIGGFTGDERLVLMVVVSQTEVIRLKNLVKDVDPKAFIIISDTAEVLGEGFKLHA